MCVCNLNCSCSLTTATKSKDPSLYKIESLVFPSYVEYEGDTYEVITVEADTFKEESSLRKLVIPDTIRYINFMAFANSKITELTIGSNVHTHTLGFPHTSCAISPHK